MVKLAILSKITALVWRKVSKVLTIKEKSPNNLIKKWKLEMENIKNEIIEKDKEIRIKESEICDLVNKLGSQFDMEKQFKEKVDIPEKKISELEKENKDLK